MALVTGLVVYYVKNHVGSDTCMEYVAYMWLTIVKS